MKNVSFLVSVILFIITSSYLSLNLIFYDKNQDSLNITNTKNNEIIYIEGKISEIIQKNRFCQLTINEIETRLSGKCPFFELVEVKIKGYKSSFMYSSWIQILEVEIVN